MRRQPSMCLCARCAELLQHPPRQISPRAGGLVPIWAAQNYGVREVKSVLLAAKDRRDPAAIETMAAAIDAMLRKLVAAGVLLDPRLKPWVLVPAPTRKSSARTRGGDPITAVCRQVARRQQGGRMWVAPLLVTREHAADSAGLSAQQRSVNLRGQLRIDAEIWQRFQQAASCSAANSSNKQTPTKTTSELQIILVDDVVTTGATLRHSVLTLGAMGLQTTIASVFSAA